MENYDFNKLLSYVDFEILSKDLLQKELSITFEVFKEGKDEGIDLRHATTTNPNNIVVQCKNYKNDFNYLLRNIKNEVEKVKKLNPDRYILSTSVELTPLNKKEIKSLFEGFIKTTSDIYGSNDLNNLLSIHKDIERKHVKLWLASTTILKHLVDKNIFEKSEDLLNEIKNKTKLYVKNDSLDIALEILNEHNFCIISGNPGVGKTTLAQMIILNYIREVEDIEVIEVTDNIEEAFHTIEKEKKQIFYYDDFLGSNFRLTKLEKNEDYKILKFINRIIKNDNKKIIFTTREYILNQAKNDFEKLQTPFMDMAKCIVDVGKFTKLVKAQILYNHLYFSKIPREYFKEILKDNNYYHIINHKNYNPRIIEHLTDSLIIKQAAIQEQNYFKFFIENLDNPIKIWESIFINEKISLSARVLCYSVFFNNYTYRGNISTKVRKDFNIIYQTLCNDLNYPIRESAYINALKEIEGSIIINNNGFLMFYDPSVSDYLVNFLNANEDLLVKIVNSLKLLEFPLEQSKLQSIFHYANGMKRSKNIKFNNGLKNLLSINILKRTQIGIKDIIFIRNNTKDIFDKHQAYILNFLKNQSIESIDDMKEMREYIDLCNFCDIKENSPLELYNRAIDILETSEFDDISNFINIRDDMHISFDDTHDFREDDIDTYINDIVDNEVSTRDDPDYLEVLKDEISCIDYSINTSILDQIDTKISRLIDEQSEDEDEELDNAKSTFSNTPDDSEKFQIATMFNTLLN